MVTPFAKYYASEMSMRTANGAVAVLGGSGFMKDYPVERYLRDSRITTIYEGTSQLQVVAAIAGVQGGLVPEVVDDVLEGVELTASLASKIDSVRAFLAGPFAEALAAVKEHPAGKDYADLSARKLVDAGLFAVIAALFARLAAKGTDAAWAASKEAALDHWLATERPKVVAGLEQVRGGYTGSFSSFDVLAQAVPVEE
jgi:alkylation response protein AidB-like acyl-CoA dehydrogenase